MENGQLRVAARTDGVLKSGFPSLAQCIESCGLAFEATVSASGVLENGGFVGAQGDREV